MVHCIALLLLQLYFVSVLLLLVCMMLVECCKESGKCRGTFLNVWRVVVTLKHAARGLPRALEDIMMCSDLLGLAKTYQ